SQANDINKAIIFSDAAAKYCFSFSCNIIKNSEKLLRFSDEPPKSLSSSRYISNCILRNFLHSFDSLNFCSCVVSALTITTVQANSPKNIFFISLLNNNMLHFIRDTTLPHYLTTLFYILRGLTQIVAAAKYLQFRHGVDPASASNDLAYF